MVLEEFVREIESLTFPPYGNSKTIAKLKEIAQAYRTHREGLMFEKLEELPDRIKELVLKILSSNLNDDDKIHLIGKIYKRWRRFFEQNKRRGKRF